MNYPLEKLVQIRKIRKQSALSRTLHAQRKLKEAETNFAIQKQKLNECHDALLEREHMLLNSSKKIRISFARLEAIQDELHSMKTIEMHCRNSLNNAASHIDDRKKEVERLKAEYHQVAKKKQKLDEHYLFWRELEKINDEKVLEDDLDELAIRNRP